MEMAELVKLVFIVIVFSVPYTQISNFTQCSISAILVIRILFPVALFIS